MYPEEMMIISQRDSYEIIDKSLSKGTHFEIFSEDIGIDLKNLMAFKKDFSKPG
jgi:hydroxymethylpyrimidine pyrophosphatase-like HAD family hydrolase